MTSDGTETETLLCVEVARALLTLRRATADGDDARLARTGTGARMGGLVELPGLASADTATGQTGKSCPDRVNRIAWAGGGRAKRREKTVHWGERGREREKGKCRR